MTTAERLTAIGIAVNAAIATINIWWSVKQRRASQAALPSAKPVDTPKRKRPRLLSPMEKRFILIFRFMQAGLVFETISAVMYPLVMNALPSTSKLDVTFYVLSFLAAVSALANVFAIEKYMIRRIKNFDVTFWKEIEDGARRLREKNKQ